MTERVPGGDGELVSPGRSPQRVPGIVVTTPRRSELEAVRALMIEAITRDYGYDDRASRHDDVGNPGELRR